MKKLFLSLSSDNFSQEQKVTISEKRPHENGANLYVRSSPIYEITPDFSFSNFENNFSGSIILLFSTQPAALFDSLKYINKETANIKIYISQGIASLVMFVPSTTSIDRNVFDNKQYLIGYEWWTINENYLVAYEYNLPDLIYEKVVNINLEPLEIEEQLGTPNN